MTRLTPARWIVIFVVVVSGLAVAVVTGYGLQHQPTGPILISPSAPSEIVRVVKPQGYNVRLVGSQLRVGSRPHDPTPGLWLHSVIEAAGSVCADRHPPGFHYSFSDVSDAGVTVAITCEANDSSYSVRVIFVPDSA